MVNYGEMSNFNNIRAMTKTRIEEIRPQAAAQDDSAVQSFF